MHATFCNVHGEVGYELVGLLSTTWFGYELVVGTRWSGYELVLYELVRVRVGIRYELAWYDLVRVRVDWKPMGAVLRCATRTLMPPGSSTPKF